MDPVVVGALGTAFGVAVTSMTAFIFKLKSANKAEVWREIGYLRENLQIERSKNEECDRRTLRQQGEITELRLTVAWLHGALGIRPSTSLPIQFPPMPGDGVKAVEVPAPPTPGMVPAA